MEIKIENLKDFLLKLTQEDIEELIKRTEKEEDRIFYNKLFNLILETKQEELIKKGVSWFHSDNNNGNEKILNPFD